MSEKFYLSIFAQFESDDARRAWMKDHVIKQCRPHNGPIFSWSSDDESSYRDLIEQLREALWFYADLSKYEGISLGVCPLNDDRGDAARKALNGGTK